MLRIDRACVYIIIFGLIFLVPSVVYTKFIDELCVAALGGIALTDCIFNGNWRKYALLWIIMLIMTFYAIYSLTCVSNNVPAAILFDWVIELKPYIPFVVLLAIGPKLTQTDKKVIKTVCWINSAISIIALLGGNEITKLILFHPTIGGNIVFISAIYILYCSIEPGGKVNKSTITHITILLILGLSCTRSKYYGLFVLAVFFLYFYKPGITKHLTVGHIMILCGICAMTVIVAWSKINFYFISGTSDITTTKFDPDLIASFARPALYMTGWFILWDYFPFGSGLASFASFASSEWYSNIFYEYGIDKVYGLSPEMSAFICDAFYPSLAQFGVVGLLLFIYYWCYVYNFLRRFLRTDSVKYKIPFIIGALIICFILIECIAGNAISQNVGVIPMMLLGIICAKAKELHGTAAMAATPQKPIKI